jgi:hypothetical protein
MRIRKWHVGKLIILWAWGSIVTAFALTDFLGTTVQSAPLLHLFEFILVFGILLILSGFTWHWLGGKES